MPKFNSRGGIAAGYGGDGHVCSINGEVVLGPPAATPGWINDYEVMSSTYNVPEGPTTYAIHKDTKEKRILYQGALDFSVCGGGRWAVKPYAPGGASNWILDNGEVFERPLMGFSADGRATISWVWAGGGLLLNDRHLSDAVVYDAQAFDPNTAIWVENGQVRTLNMPIPTMLPGGFHNLQVAIHNGEYWVLYQSEFNGRLVAHPFHSTEGYYFNEPFNPYISETWAYRPDIVSVDGNLNVCWAVIESEFPSQVRFRRQNMEDWPTKVQLLDKVAETPKPVPPPTKPKPEEPKVPTPELKPEAKIIITDVWNAKIGKALEGKTEGKEAAAATSDVLFEAAFHAHQIDPRIGLYPKTSGTNYNGFGEDIILIKEDGKVFWKDVVGSISTLNPQLHLDGFNLSSEPDKWVKPPKPANTPVEPPAPPVPPPPPQPVCDCAKVKAELLKAMTEMAATLMQAMDDKIKALPKPEAPKLKAVVEVDPSSVSLWKKHTHGVKVTLIPEE